MFRVEFSLRIYVGVSLGLRLEVLMWGAINFHAKLKVRWVMI